MMAPSAVAATCARIVGAGMTALHKSQPLTAVELMVQALQAAVQDTRGLLRLQDIDTLIALPSLMSSQHFMIGHAVAQQVCFADCARTETRGMHVRLSVPLHSAVLYQCICVLLFIQAKLTPRKGMLVRTLDVGGAGP